MTKPSAKTTNPLDRLEQLGREQASRRAAERERNRREFPGLTRIVDMARKAGLNVSLVYGEEAGKTVGKRQPFEGVSLEGYEAALYYGSKRK